jgi:hypothetical protein
MGYPDMGSCSESAAMNSGYQPIGDIATRYGCADICCTVDFMKFIMISSLGAQPQRWGGGLQLWRRRLVLLPIKSASIKSQAATRMVACTLPLAVDSSC